MSHADVPDGQKCVYCGIATGVANYCSWEHHIEHAKSIGGQVLTPNGLPIVCIRCDGLMLEHEHADHPDYKFPVVVDFVGEVTDDMREGLYVKHLFPGEATDEQIRRACGETHALIYCDEYIAVTIYECTYALWRLSTGACLGGSMWEDKKNWRLSEGALEKVKGLYEHH